MAPIDPAALTTVHVRRAAAGDAGSVEWLVERLTPLLLSQAEWRMGPLLRRSYDPRDIVHEAWMVLLPRIEQLAPRDGRLTPVLLKFLSSTILGKVRNLLRREIRRLGDGGGRSGAAAAGAGQPETLAGPRSEVVSSVVRRERVCQVTEALAALPEIDREVLLLRGIEQLEPADVAERLGISRDALSKRYRRALARLGEAMPDSVFSELVPDEGGDATR
ncbi:MAG: sigma-70 family RNA polymerase sigma factor [Planctomycetes bacterium]|nr:sigma-70 family RNA polymerase sigma factor [Planctomycetota bacterium]